MNRRRALIAAAGAAGVLLAGTAIVVVVGSGSSPDRLDQTAQAPGPAVVTIPAPTPSAEVSGDPSVRWEPGPWGEVVVAGHRLLLPASPTDGPLRDRGDGWSSDYAPTATAAAIAVLRGPWLVFAAPGPLRPTVVETVLTKAAAADPGPVNPWPGWALPPDVLAGFADQDLRTLGATATLTDDDRATVQVFLQRTDPAGTTLIRTLHRLVWSDRQWLIDADYSDATGEPITPAQLPARFTITAPEG